mmetsp:Transcript_11918/g.24312  ORF Transcript_11918/g.24312 Transcript_11918/m.24312 type:complete len:99 (-) Transcript_11918:6-302(-)
MTVKVLDLMLVQLLQHWMQQQDLLQRWSQPQWKVMRGKIVLSAKFEYDVPITGFARFVSKESHSLAWTERHCLKVVKSFIDWFNYSGQLVFYCQYISQ